MENWNILKRGKLNINNCAQHRVKKIAGKSLLTKILADFLGSYFIYEIYCLNYAPFLTQTRWQQVNENLKNE
jgi:hypothetical protein